MIHATRRQWLVGAIALMLVGGGHVWLGHDGAVAARIDRFIRTRAI